MKQIAFIIAITSLLLFSCGSGEETSWDHSTPEGLARLVFEEMVSSADLYEDYRQPPFDCASQYYFGSENIIAYYGDENLSIRNCQKLKDDAKNSMYTRLENSSFTPVNFVIDDEGFIQSTKVSESLPYVESTLYLSDGSRLHFNRMVQHNGLWYVLVLSANLEMY